jgi:hypothetical protein
MAGGKYCRRCECYFVTIDMFCKCCGIQLRTIPKQRVSREKFRAKKELIAAGRSNRDALKVDSKALLRLMDTCLAVNTTRKY